MYIPKLFSGGKDVMPLFNLGKTKLPHKKDTRFSESVIMSPPRTVTIPLSQHIGTPVNPVVKAGEEVYVGTVIGDTDAYVSSPVHSSVSGTVVKVDNFLGATGVKAFSVIIESDGLMTPDPSLRPVEVNNIDELVSAARRSGAVGLGGAGFPTSVKLAALSTGKIDTVIINGAECEPYITSDTRTFVEDIELVRGGIERLLSLSKSIEVVVGVEKNNDAAIQSISANLSGIDRLRVQALSPIYPQGAEKVLIYNTTGRVVEEGELPASVGVIVLNVTTLAFIERYIRTGMPLTSKRITVEGGAVREPKNVIAPIGASVGDVIEFAGGLSEEPEKILFGGPMMGVAMYTLDTPIIKNCNAIVCLTKKEANVDEPTACIHCGACIAACPLGLNPVTYSRIIDLPDREDRIRRLEEYRVNICMECGCCSYVCPAKRPLVTNNKLAKAMIREYHAEIKKREEMNK